MRKYMFGQLIAASLVLAATACSSPAIGSPPIINSAPVQNAALKDVFAGDFMIGAALNPEQFEERDAASVALIKRHFNSVTPENVLKWESVHPEPGSYSFGPADKYVDFGTKNNMFVIGHTLVWHSQTPAWVFRDDAGATISRDSLVARMRDHIRTVVGRYKGRIKGWDVVNEALNEDGTMRKSPWLNIIGDDFVALAFQFAHEADPAAQLYYNDYSLENPAKRDGAIRLVKSLQAKGITVAGIGSQAHVKMDWPSVALEDSMITMFAATGAKVHITELDVDVLPSNSANRGADVSLRIEENRALNPWPDSLPAAQQSALARRYADLFEVFKKHAAHIDRITFWGVSDGDSWLNGWPIRGRTSYPLVFDRQHRTKPAFDAIVRVGRSGIRS